MNSILALLTKEIGVPMARALFNALRPHAAQDKWARVQNLINTGATALNALRSVFGKEFADAVRLISQAPSGWTYEAGTKDYVRLPIDGSDLKRATDAMRDELNLNLDRVVRSGGDVDQFHNYLRGAVSVWLERFEQRFTAADRRVTPMVKAVRQRLKSQESTVSKLIRLSGLASIVTGTLLLLKAVMLFFSFGLGLFALLSALLFGVPFLAIAGFVLCGVLLIVGGTTVARRGNCIRAAKEVVEAAYAALDTVGGRDTQT